MSEGKARRARLLRAGAIALCAAALAWLGPEWEIPRALAALGTALMLAIAAATLCHRGASGAWPRAALLVLPVLCAVILPGLVRDTFPRGHGSVLVELFAPGGDERACAAVRSRLGVEEIGAGAIRVAFSLGEPAGRARLGTLAGYGRPLTEAEAARVSSPVVAVNGVILSDLEEPGKVVERAALPVAPAAILCAGEEVTVTYRGPPGATLSLLVAAPCGPEGTWHAARALLGPERVDSGPLPDGGSAAGAPEGVVLAATFRRAGVGGNHTLIAIAELEGRVVWAGRIPARGDGASGPPRHA